MIFLITGSRSIAVDFETLLKTASPMPYKTICKSDLMIFGDARGVDNAAFRFATRHHIPFERWVAEWNVVDAPNAILKQSKNGKWYNVLAGKRRNQKMVERALELSELRKEQIAGLSFWDGKSTGTFDMMTRIIGAGIELFVFDAQGRKVEWAID